MNVSMQIKRPPLNSTYDSFSTMLSLDDGDLPDELQQVPVGVRVQFAQLLCFKSVLISAVMQGTMTVDEFKLRYANAYDLYHTLIPTEFVGYFKFLHLEISGGSTADSSDV